MAGYRKLGRTSNQRKALLRNQVTNLLYNGKIVTTEAKAKEIRKIAEHMIALAVKEKDNFETVTVTAKVARKDKDGKRVFTTDVVANSVEFLEWGENTNKTSSSFNNNSLDYPEMDGKTVAWVNFSANDMSQLHLYTPADPRGSFLIELGMEYPESVTDQITDPTAYSLSLSAENADMLNDADIIIGYGDETLYEAVKADPLLGEIPAIQRGSVVFIGNNTALAASGNPNPLSISYTIDEYLELIGGAITKLNE